MPQPTPGRRPGMPEPPLLIALGVGIVVFLFFFWRAPEFDGVLADRPDFAIGRPPATQFPSVTGSPVFGPSPTPRPPTVTPTPEPGAEDRDNQRRRDLLTIAALLEEYVADNGSYPQSGNNAQSLCVYRELDAGCALLDYAPDEELPQNPRGDPYQYLSDGESWAVFMRLEEEISEEQRCTNPAAASFPDPEQLICATGGSP